jgi:hypothetical protein
MGNDFAPKGEDILRQELIEATGLDPDLPENQDFINKTVALRLKDEQMKASLHDSKEKKKKTIAELEAKLKSNPKQDEEKKGIYALPDIRALQDVPDEDVDQVVEYAKFKGISIAEAKQTPVIKNILKENAETRQTALATQTGGGRHGTTKLDDSSLINAAKSGSLKEDDLDKLAEARMNEKKKMNK